VIDHAAIRLRSASLDPLLDERGRRRFAAACEIDPNTDPAGIKVSDAEIAAINIQRHEFHGDCNDTVIVSVRGCT
jgi:hypothetical protein